MSPTSPSTAVLLQEEIHYLDTLQYWSLITAYGLAAAEGINLTQEHIKAILWIREDYDKFGNNYDEDFIVRKLEKSFGLVDANLYLKMLFPLNPISQWMRIAGLPVQPEKLHSTH